MPFSKRKTEGLDERGPANPLKHAVRNCSQRVPLKQHVFKNIAS